MKKTFLFLCFSVLFNSFAGLISAQDSYQIEIQLQDNHDSVFYLAYYYGDKFFIADTSNISPGLARFQGSEPLKQGIYLLSNQNKEKLIEFLVGTEQKFLIKANLLQQGQNNLSVEGSKDNSVFFETIRLMNEVQKQRQERENQVSADHNPAKPGDAANSPENTLEELRNKTIRDYPSFFIAKLLSAMNEPEIPDEIKNDKEASYRFYKNHFWDGFDLSDDRLLRTPLLPMKLKTYFEQLILPEADTVIKEADRLMTATKGNQEVIDFLAWHFAGEYQNPKIMGLDKVFVHFVDHYFDAGKVKNLTPSILEKLDERAGKMRLSLIGNKAPDMWLVDTTGNYRSFNELENKYLVIVFWDQTCSHCKKEMEIINLLYESKKYDLGVYAVNTTNDFEGWKHYISEKKYHFFHVNGMKSITPDFHNLYDIYSVPVIYLLDKNKKIIAKRIGAEQLETILKNQ